MSHPLHEAWKVQHAANAATVDMPRTHMWKVTHVAEDRTARTQFVLAATNAEADAHMASLYGLPVFSAALRVPEGSRTHV